MTTATILLLSIVGAVLIVEVVALLTAPSGDQADVIRALAEPIRAVTELVQALAELLRSTR